MYSRHLLDIHLVSFVRKLARYMAGGWSIRRLDGLAHRGSLHVGQSQHYLGFVLLFEEIEEEESGTHNHNPCGAN